jgi:glucose-6-phosphate-specific signal transduction histidine kinase
MAASMCVWAVSQFALAREQIPVVILPQITYLAAIAFIIGHGIATLVLYGRETEAGNV